jgi:hypothetical protein
MAAPRRIRVVGVHRYFPTPEVFEDTVEVLYGSPRDELEREQFHRDVKEHFEQLYLIEIEVEPAGADIAWAEITQPDKTLPPSSWQAPFDERPLDKQKSRWVFFFHFLKTDQALQTPCGKIKLPAVTPLPRHLAGIVYQAP